MPTNGAEINVRGQAAGEACGSGRRGGGGAFRRHLVNNGHTRPQCTINRLDRVFNHAWRLRDTPREYATRSRSGVGGQRPGCTDGTRFPFGRGQPPTSQRRRLVLELVHPFAPQGIEPLRFIVARVRARGGEAICRWNAIYIEATAATSVVQQVSVTTRACFMKKRRTRRAYRRPAWPWRRYAIHSLRLCFRG